MISVQPRQAYGYNGIIPTQTPGAPRLSTTARRSVAFTEPSRPLSALDEYECPPLPPVSEIKSAISRQKVCEGVSYVLPVDKTKNSVENVFRTNLRVMFKDPYRDEVQQLNGEQLLSITRHQYRPNTGQQEYNWQSPGQYQLSAESSRVLQNFARSAPRTGTSGRRTLGDTEQRSKLYLPIMAQVPEEVQRLKEEADKILQSVEADNNSPTDARNTASASSGRAARSVKIATIRSNSATSVSSKSKSQPGSGDKQQPRAIPQRPSSKAKRRKKKKRLTQFESFEELNSIHVPSKREVPDNVKSQYLTDNKNNDIWLWLHEGKPQTDLDFFLEACS